MSNRMLPLFFITILLALLLSVFAATQMTNKNSSLDSIIVSPPTISVNFNGTFEVNISICDVSDLYGWEFKLGWNTSLLDVVNVTEESFLNSSRDTYFVSKVMSTDGYVLVGCTSLRNVNGVAGNGTLATVEFRAKKLGSCILDLYDTKLVNSAKQLMEHSEVDGTVTISGSVLIRVQYLDGCPRSGADVRKSWPLPYWPLGTTNESGMMTSQGVLTGPQDYQVQAWYGARQFGPNTPIHIDENGEGSVTITSDLEITPPSIAVFSPQNLTYRNISVPLTFAVYDFSSISWIGYSLDNQSNTTVTGNTTISVEDGAHEIVVYANDTFGNMGSSQTVYFTVNTLAGDLNNDRVVDIFDITTVALAFNSKPGDSNWNPIADINSDNLVDIFDIVVVALHFGETS